MPLTDRHLDDPLAPLNSPNSLIFHPLASVNDIKNHKFGARSSPPTAYHPFTSCAFSVAANTSLSFFSLLRSRAAILLYIPIGFLTRRRFIGFSLAEHISTRARHLIRIAPDARTSIGINRFYEQVDAVAVEAITNSTALACFLSFSPFDANVASRCIAFSVLARFDGIVCRHVYWPSRDSSDCIRKKKNDYPDSSEKRICSKTVCYTIEATGDLLHSMVP